MAEEEEVFEEEEVGVSLEEFIGGATEHLVDGQRILRFTHTVDIPIPSSIEVFSYTQQQLEQADSNIREFWRSVEYPPVAIKQERFSDTEEDPTIHHPVPEQLFEVSLPSDSVSFPTCVNNPCGFSPELLEYLFRSRDPREPLSEELENKFLCSIALWRAQNPDQPLPFSIESNQFDI